MYRITFNVYCLYRADELTAAASYAHFGRGLGNGQTTLKRNHVDGLYGAVLGAGSGRSRTHFNGDMLPAEVERYCVLGKQEKMFAENLFRRLRMSARGFHRLLKVARTIADLEGEERILVPHLAEAAAYRFRYDAAEML